MFETIKALLYLRVPGERSRVNLCAQWILLSKVFLPGSGGRDRGMSLAARAVLQGTERPTDRQLITAGEITQRSKS